jgi:hypothetical protein
MVAKLQRLSSTTQEALKQLACLGSVAPTAMLALVADSGPSRTVIPAHCGQHSGDCGQFLMSV